MNVLSHYPVLIRQDLDRRVDNYSRAQRSEPSRPGSRVGAAALAAAVLAAAILLSVPAPASAATDIGLVSEASNGYADDASSEASVSADGRYVAFSSYATNLSDDDGDGARDVFVRDMSEGTTELVSRANGVDGAGGQADSYEPSVSANGRYVAFTSLYDEFTDEDAPGLDVFVRDLETGTTTLVSRASGTSGDAADSPSIDPSISANGRFVTFESNADNLSNREKDTNNVFVRDLKEATTTLVSRKSGAKGPGAGSSSGEGAISANGRYVAFYSTGDNLSRADDDQYANIYVRDLKTNETTLVSRRSGGRPGANGASYAPSISASGDRVAFMSGATNLGPKDVSSGIYVHDRGSQRTVFASKANGKKGEPGDGDSTHPSISANGRRVAFSSSATNLSPVDGDAYFDVFVRDIKRDKTFLASLSNEGDPGDGDSERPSLSANGGFVAYASEANSLSPDDADTFSDVFRTPVPLGPAG